MKIRVRGFYIVTPTWFITILLANSKSPICLYYTDKHEQFDILERDYDERYRLIANNPVATTKFFDLITSLFI